MYKLKSLITIIIVATLLDVATTLYGLSIGLWETNPIVNKIGMPLGILFRLLFPAFYIWFLLRKPHYKWASWLQVLCWVQAIVMLMVPVWNGFMIATIFLYS